MYVYLQDKTSRKFSGGGLRWKMYGDITLVDGSVPVIGNQEASITGLEPAVWFKVLLVDSVCIDLDNECVYWSTCRRPLCKKRNMSYQPFERCNHTHECLLNEEFFLPDVDLKRGLEIATRILNGQQESQQDLLHLLHVYILPIIRLHADDKEHVSVALQNQKEVLHELDSKLDKMTKQRGNIKGVMRQWRGDICKTLQSDKDIAGCNREFLKVLCQHLEEDIQNAYVQLDICQQAVEVAKKKVEKKEGNNYITQLTRARKNRDEVADYITKALYVVEEVSLMFDMVRRPPSVEIKPKRKLRKVRESRKMSDMQLGYIKINKEWEDHTNELRELQRRKVCATSVREALVSTKSELEHTNDTLGIDLLSTGTGRATDILDPHSLPKEWEQLQTHVKEALETQEHLRDPHLEFCHYLSTSCQEEISNIRMHQRDRGPSFSKTTKLLIEQRLKPGPEALRSLRASLKERKPATHFQGMTKKLLKDTNDHFTQMVKMMVMDFSVPSTCSARLWTCYERCIFPEVNDSIMKVYKEAYKMETKQLREYLPSVSVTELGLDDEWILNILGLYAPSSLTQGFAVDTQEPGLHRNSCDDTEPDLNASEQCANCTENTCNVDGADSATHQTVDCQANSQNSPNCFGGSHSNCVEHDPNCTQTSAEICQKTIVTADISLQNSIIGSGNPHMTKSDSDQQSEQEAYLARFEQWKLTCDALHNTERPDFESSTRSEPATSVVRRRKPRGSRDTRQSNRLTKVVGHKWVIPPARSNSYTAPERPKYSQEDGSGPASLPSMLDAEIRMSSMIGPTSLPIDIPAKRTSETVADSGVCFESVPGGETPPFQSATENTNNSRHNNDESLNPCDIPIVVTSATESTGDEPVENELSKRRKDPYVAAFLERFQTAYYCFRVVLQESVPTSKFQWLCKCLKEVNDVAEKQAQLIFCGKKRMLCGDDLLTTLILFVLHGEPDEMVQAFPQLKFMEDYLPEFLDKGQFGFSVYQFILAFQYILDKHEAMKRLNEECNGS